MEGKVNLFSGAESTLSDSALNETQSSLKKSDQSEVEMQPLISHISEMDREECMDHISTLHDQVEKMFEVTPQFDLKSLSSDDAQVESHHFTESDYKSHRRTAFPHVHHPLKSMHSRSFKFMKGVKRKKKSKLSGTCSFPSKIAAQSPIIPEVEVEEYIEDMGLSDEEDFSLREISSEKVEEPVEKPDDFYKDSSAVGFYIGEDKDHDFPSILHSSEIHNVPSFSHEQSSSSVAAQTFQRQTIDEPETTPMFEIDDEPRPSQHAAFSRLSGSEKLLSDPPKVSFVLGSGEPLNDVWIKRETEEVDSLVVKPQTTRSAEKMVHKQLHGHHHHHHHEHFRRQDLMLRRKPGSKVHLDEKLHRVPTEKDEASMLKKSDLDEMASHRFEDVRGIRRHKYTKHSALASIVHIGRAEKLKRKLFKQTKYDHKPHEMFVELDVLNVIGDEQDWEWQEKARWIKFEEDVEEGAERWGKPHVASLSFHSMLELRKGLEKGVFLFDLEVKDLPSIIHNVVENMAIQDLIKGEQKGNVLRTLLLKHKHVETNAFLRRNFSYMNLIGLENAARQRHQREKSIIKSLSTASFSSFGSSLNLSKTEKGEESGHQRDRGDYTKLDVDIDNNMQTDGTHLLSTEQRKKHVQDIMKRIPQDAEATTVLVGSVNYLESPAMAFVRLAEGQILGNLTEVPLPTRFLFVLLGPKKSEIDFYEVGRSISTLMSNKNFHDMAYKAESRAEFLLGINNFLTESIVLPPGDWDQKTLLPIMDMARKRANIRRRKKAKQEEKKGLIEEREKLPVDSLQRTKRPFGGLINDIKRRYLYYWSDFADGLNFQCLAAILFIFFACVSPCVAFGGLLGEKTKGLMGVTETVLSTSLCGVVFAMLGGQPLMLLGATGPVLVFEESLYKFCVSSDIEFLPLRCWIGFWVTVIATLVVAVEGSFLVRFVTRFTEEIFAILISLIFIYEVIKKLNETYQKHPLIADCTVCCQNSTDNSTARGELLSLMANENKNLSEREDPHCEYLKKSANQPNTALLSTILALGTFFIAYFLRIFRNSKFLGRSARRALGDFGVVIALVVMVLLDYLIKDTCTQKLKVPDEFGPTARHERGWFINPMGMKQHMKIWLIFASVIPGFLIFILLFMEVQITEVILSKKLKKGSGFHLDMFLVGILTGLCSLFGLPWMCAGTVRSVAHKASLSVMSRTHAPGEKPKFLYVKEQRLTSLLVNILIGASLTVGPLLQEIPMAVLFGVFLYLGFSSMSGVQMYERTKLLFMPVKHHPSIGYVRRVRTFRMNVYTLIQLSFLGALWVVKSTAAALAFPFFLILLVPVRLKLISYFFTPSELHELDKEEEDGEDEEEDDPDFYQLAHMPI